MVATTKNSIDNLHRLWGLDNSIGMYLYLSHVTCLVFHFGFVVFISLLLAVAREMTDEDTVPCGNFASEKAC